MLICVVSGKYATKNKRVDLSREHVRLGARVHCPMFNFYRYKYSYVIVAPRLSTVAGCHKPLHAILFGH